MCIRLSFRPAVSLQRNCCQLSRPGRWTISQWHQCMTRSKLLCLNFSQEQWNTVQSHLLHIAWHNRFSLIDNKTPLWSNTGSDKKNKKKTGRSQSWNDCFCYFKGVGGRWWPSMPVSPLLLPITNKQRHKKVYEGRVMIWTLASAV